MMIDFGVGSFPRPYQDEGYTVDTIRGTGASSDPSGRFRCRGESGIALPYLKKPCAGGGEQARLQHPGESH